MEKKELLDKLDSVRLELYYLHELLPKVIYKIVKELDEKEKNIDKYDPKKTLRYLNRVQNLINTIVDAIDDFE